MGDRNRHKRLAKKVYMVFKGREPQISVNESWRAKYFEEMTQVQAKELNNIWVSTELEESLGGDLWIQNLTLTIDVITVAPQETHNQTPQTLLAGSSLAEPSLAELSLAESSLAKMSLAEPSLAEPSLAELSHSQLAEYDQWIQSNQFLINRSCSSLSLKPQLG